MAQRQIPGGAFLNEVGTAQRQIPGGAFVNETVSVGGGTVESGAGASAGVATVAGIGAAIAAGVGASAGIAVAAAVGEAVGASAAPVLSLAGVNDITETSARPKVTLTFA